MSLAADMEEKAQRHNKRAGRLLAQELGAQREMERMHLETIRKEKMRLQKELERVRNKGQYLVGRKPPSKSTRLLQSRFASQSSLDPNQSMNSEADRQVATSPSPSRRSGLPRLPSDNEDSPLETEYRSRNSGYDSFVNRKQISNQRQRRELEIEQNFLNARVEQFTRSLTPQKPRKSSPPEIGEDEDGKEVTYEEVIPLDGKDRKKYDLISSSSSDSLRPKPKKSRQMTIADYDVNHAKHSVAKRLLSESNDSKVKESGREIVHPALNQNGGKKPMRRRSTQVALLDRDQVNKYSQVEDQTSQRNDAAQINNTEKKAQSIKELPSRDSEVQLNMKGVGANTRRQVLQIIENPDLQFDDDLYAPDGELRTIHMLPDQDEAFEEARHARYLRWRDPKDMVNDKELSIGDIFAKDASGRYVPDVGRTDDGQTVTA